MTDPRNAPAPTRWNIAKAAMRFAYAYLKMRWICLLAGVSVAEAQRLKRLHDLTGKLPD